MLRKSMVVLAGISMIVSACNSSGSSTGAGTGTVKSEERPPEPIELVMLQDGATITDDEFANYIAAPVRAKYPHITITMMRNNKGNEGLSNLISSGSFPDLIFTTYPQIKINRELGTAQDLNDMIQKFKMDTGKFDPAALQTSKIYGNSDHLFALPFSLNFLATFYNKDLFDKFGVAYPKEGITWDEAIQLSKSFDRTLENISYRGLMTNGASDLSTQLSLPYVNAGTNKAQLTTDGWKRLLDLLKAINDVPGNKGATLDHFLKDQTLAMVASYDARFAALEKLQGTSGQFNWNVTQYPSYPDKPNVSLASSGHFLIVSSLGKHKEEAFQVVDLLTSDDIQKLITENGRFTSLKNETIKSLYGKNMKSMQGKDIKAVFKSAFSPPFPPTKYDSFVITRLNEAVKKVTNGETDINSALREAEEAANRDIAAQPK
ncbi:ABC transporter substrate-binding protein [Paenibacillus hodogayensis]|uniref:ABC transporter substrate-binding protein n=1 Tax=Paenibacillus hodogayensis TaxID=279208 RepID=A0ABV5VZV8_9BACL